MEPNGGDVLELGAKASGCLNHAYVSSEEIETPQFQQETPPVMPRVEATPKERRRIVRNVATLSVAFMCNFMTKYGVSNLQSSLNAAHGLGTASLAAVYGGLLLSNATLPAIILRCVSQADVTAKFC
jgi:hypothetical protein